MNTTNDIEKKLNNKHEFIKFGSCYSAFAYCFFVRIIYFHNQKLVHFKASYAEKIFGLVTLYLSIGGESTTTVE